MDLRHVKDAQAQEGRDLVELLAAYAHEAWSGWMRYMFSKCGQILFEDSFLEDKPRAVIHLPRDLFDRWQRQMQTPYSDLPEEEKKSDRAEAYKMLTLIEGEPRCTGGE